MSTHPFRLKWLAVPAFMAACMICLVALLAFPPDSFERLVSAEKINFLPEHSLSGSLAMPAANVQTDDIICLKGDRGACDRSGFPPAGASYGDVFQLNLTTGEYKYTECPSFPDIFFPSWSFQSGFIFLPILPSNRMVTGKVVIHPPINLGGGCTRYHFFRPSPTLGGRFVVDGDIVRCNVGPVGVTVTGRVEIRYAKILPSGGKASTQNILCDTILTSASCTCGG